jgi:HK97 family phage major capsid protein
MLTIEQKRALYDERARLVTAYQDAPKAAAAEKREMNADENIKREKIWADFEKVDGQIADFEKEDKRAHQITESEAREAEKNPGRRMSADERETQAKDYLRAMFLPAAYAMAGKELPAEDKRAFSTLAANVGGNTVPTLVYDKLLLALSPYAWWDGLGEIIHTDSGNPMTFPTGNDTGNVASIVADSGTISADATTPFSSYSLGAFKYTTGQIGLSYELLMDTAVDIEAIVLRMIAERFGRKWMTDFTTGAGTTLPFGFITGATQASLTTPGKVGVPQYADIVKLYFAVNSMYRESPYAAFMANDTTLAAIYSLVDTAGRPLVNLQSINDGIRPVMLGKPIISNLAMASAALNAKSLAFGDFSAYKIRLVRDMNLVVQREALATLGQIGYVATWRADGKLADAGTHPIQYLTGAAS